MANKIINCIHYNKTKCEHKTCATRGKKCLVLRKQRCFTQKEYRRPPNIHSPRFRRY